MNQSLEILGFNQYFNKLFTPFEEQDFAIGRVVQENKSRYQLYTQFGWLMGELTGKLLFTTPSPADLPKVGDWVVISVFEQEQKAIIH